MRKAVWEKSGIFFVALFRNLKYNGKGGSAER